MRSLRLDVNLVDSPFEQPLGLSRLSRHMAEAIALGAIAAQNLSVVLYARNHRARRCLALRRPTALTLDLNIAAVTFAVALSWYGPETLLALLNRWHFSWRMPLLFILRDLMLPIVYIDAWCNHFVWRGNEMSLSAEEPSVEQG